MIANFYKENPEDKVWWVDVLESIDDESAESTNIAADYISAVVPMGQLMISFDKKKIYNLWTDYPDKMTPEEVELFSKENPYWADFFADRKKGVDKNKN